jgi:predicted nucleic acid-binding protein
VRIGLDTNIFLASLKKEKWRYKDVEVILEGIYSGKIEGCCSILTLMEISQFFYRSGDEDGALKALEFFDEMPNLLLVSLDKELAPLAGQLYRQYRLPTVDNLILSSLISYGIDVFITYDNHFQKVKLIRIQKPRAFRRKMLQYPSDG